ncbi:hypothetical protein JG687_00002502 [Phytophthora cactorum]|uniref:Uncharacterized protein n=1 Tax=Phytophthora cactorum TaxID=29920 RepID=A0A8T1UYT8_9STRA|nr:hypothetical protein JG687_00002502 [Phytophthora cactorum]
MRLNTDDLEEVNKLRKIEVSREKMLKLIWDHTDSEPRMVDVHNLLAEIKREEEGGTSVSDRVAETLSQYCDDESYGVGHVDIDQYYNQVSARFLLYDMVYMLTLLLDV